MKTSDFYYDLPEELIAQDPLEDRSFIQTSAFVYERVVRVEAQTFHTYSGLSE